MIDGYALIEINTKGEARAKEHTFLDIRLDGHVEFHDSEGTDQLHSQLPEDLKDVLVMVFFKYDCNSSKSYDGEWDVEEIYTLASHTVMKTDYKEFYRLMVTEEFSVIGGYEKIDEMPDDESTEAGSCSDKNYYNGLLEEWETFYDEDFEPTKRKELNPFSSLNIFENQSLNKQVNESSASLVQNDSEQHAVASGDDNRLPDIDIDLDNEKSRDYVVNYLRRKQDMKKAVIVVEYGEEKELNTFLSTNGTELSVSGVYEELDSADIEYLESFIEEKLLAPPEDGGN